MLDRDEIQPRCLKVEVKGRSLVLQTACSPWLVEELETDRGLQVFSRLPEREHQRLLEIARGPEKVLSLAYTPSGVIIGQVTLAPLHGWGGELPNTYEIACEVSSSWRRKGIARRLLTLVLETEGSVSSLWCLVGRSPVGRATHLRRVIGFAIILTGLVTGVRVRRKKHVLAIFQEHHPSHRHI